MKYRCFLLCENVNILSDPKLIRALLKFDYWLRFDLSLLVFCTIEMWLMMYLSELISKYFFNAYRDYIAVHLHPAIVVFSFGATSDSFVYLIMWFGNSAIMKNPLWFIFIVFDVTTNEHCHLSFWKLHSYDRDIVWFGSFIS